MQLREFIFQISLTELSQLLLTEVEDEAVDAQLKKFRDFDFVIKALQDESVTLAEARALYEEVIQRFTSSAERLRTKAAIVENKAF